MANLARGARGRPWSAGVAFAWSFCHWIETGLPDGVASSA
eukprot:CAMPEP_0184257784 /NCGR_PEP_ID=MMETSP0977-20130417/9605_1 /TAXON_ID=483370 /ORGANISM="non described non described, Strain CCMP2097" /LENGTH=39 /DNA_ID= /DNA_START= /DNA_END= /DNA_ORIENTATION=